jgi:hypothetical protein
MIKQKGDKSDIQIVKKRGRKPKKEVEQLESYKEKDNILILMEDVTTKSIEDNCDYINELINTTNITITTITTIMTIMTITKIMTIMMILFYQTTIQLPKKPLNIQVKNVVENQKEVKLFNK